MSRSGGAAERTVLLTLGRLPKALELARALHGAGARVIVADPFATHLCRPSRAVALSRQTPSPRDDPSGWLAAILGIVAEECVDLVIPVSEEAPYTTLLAGRLQAPARLFGPDHDGLTRLHDKLQFPALAREAGLRVPDTFRADTAEAAHLAATEDYIVKPRHGCSGQGLRLRRHGEPLTLADTAPRNIVQRRIHGREISSQTIAHDGRIIGTSLYRGLVFSGTVACCFERIECAAAEAWIRDFVAARRYSGFIAFDFIIDADGTPWPIECNPRLTSGLHFMEPADVACAVLDPANAQSIAFKPHQRFQEGHTTLTKVYSALPKPREASRRFRAMISARDALWSWQDPGPFLLMTPMSWPILRQTIFEGRGFGDAATRDLEWVDQSALSFATGTEGSRP